MLYVVSVFFTNNLLLLKKLSQVPLLERVVISQFYFGHCNLSTNSTSHNLIVAQRQYGLD